MGKSVGKAFCRARYSARMMVSSICSSAPGMPWSHEPFHCRATKEAWLSRVSSTRMGVRRAACSQAFT